MEPNTEAAIRTALEEPGDRTGRARRVAALIRGGGGYRWVGIYEVRDEEARALAWSGSGAPAFPVIPIAQGLTGAAVTTGSTVVADDVGADPRYLTALESTRSEIIVPVRDPETGRVLGTVDVESERTGAFGELDQAALERIARTLPPLFEDD